MRKTHKSFMSLHDLRDESEIQALSPASTHRISGYSLEEEILSSKDFEELFPLVCRKFHCEFDVFIKKDMLEDRAQRSQSFPIVSARSAVHVNVAPKVSLIKTVHFPEVDDDENHDVNHFTLHTVYDAQSNLVEILVQNQKHRIPRAIMQVLTMIAPMFSDLRRITISNCIIDSNITHELNKLLIQSSLTDINFDGTYLFGHNYVVLLDRVSTLKNLSLNRCNIQDEGCKEIASRLRFQGPAETNLTTLSLSGNKITDYGAQSLGEMLRTNRQLRYLNLAANLITDDGAGYLLNAIVEFPLTYDELVAKRGRLLEYLKRRRQLIKKFLEDNVSAVDLISTVRSNISHKKRKSSAYSRRSTASSGKKLRLQQGPEIPPTPEDLAELVLGKYRDPFASKSITDRDSWVYSQGNKILAYLNLAYNHLSYLSIRKILNALQYQMDSGDHLIKIRIEGNNIPKMCQEYENIDNFYMQMYSKIRLSSTGKLKTPRRATKTSKVEL